MKKTFLARRNALFSSTTRVSWGLVALVIAIIFASVRLVAPNFFLHILAPLFESSHNVTEFVYSQTQGFKDASALSERNKQLQLENQALIFENKTLLEELNDVRAFSSEFLPKDIIAGVLVAPPESPYDTLVLSVGSADAVEVGMRVFGPGGVPIGSITEVTEDFSRATLFSSAETITQGWVGDGRMPVLMRGVGGGAVEALVPRSIEVQNNDQVFAPGPGALPFGTVVEIFDDLSSPQLELRIMPAINPSSVTWVIIRRAGMHSTL